MAKESETSKRKADIKVVIIGDACVGKTTFIKRYIEGQFTENTETLGACFYLKQWGPHNIAIWDTAGEERFSGLNSFYCREASAAIVAYDITNPESFQRLHERYIPLLESAKDDCLLCVTGMKLDLEPSAKFRVPSSEAEDFSARLNFDRYKNQDRYRKPFFETSSLTGEGVNEVFEFIFKTLLTNGKPLAPQKSLVDLEKTPQPREKPACC
ncbi:Ras-related protein Rab-20 [Holothuria leucospilota]|uniref:Ras-related protein Rab-20 n=1 Tax=Holothuria leucospilota TaxID=206669 RepID=A0A9Q1BCV9_HOLLE|nr:Ras-related protein Rab-20 [Holothuria leucospilota]